MEDPRDTLDLSDYKKALEQLQKVRLVVVDAAMPR